VIKVDNGAVVAMKGQLADIKIENDHITFTFVGINRTLEFEVPVSMGLIAEDYVKFVERIYFYFNDSDDDTYAYNTLVNIVADCVNYVTR
jgi:hypothetical protein